MHGGGEKKCACTRHHQRGATHRHSLEAHVCAQTSTSVVRHQQTQSRCPLLTCTLQQYFHGITSRKHQRRLAVENEPQSARLPFRDRSWVECRNSVRTSHHHNPHTHTHTPLIDSVCGLHRGQTVLLEPWAASAGCLCMNHAGA